MSDWNLRDVNASTEDEAAVLRRKNKGRRVVASYAWDPQDAVDLMVILGLVEPEDLKPEYQPPPQESA